MWDALWRGAAPLHIAAQIGHVSVVQALITVGADIDVRDGDGGRTPFFMAAYYGHPEIVAVLSAAGADVHMPNWLHETPMHAAANRGHTAVLRALKSLGLRVNAPDMSFRTPMHLAADYGHAEAIQTLKDLGASVDIWDRSGRSPLDLALEELPDLKAVQALLQAGADASIKPALERVKGNTKPKFKEIISLLEEHLKQNPTGIKPRLQNKQSPAILTQFQTQLLNADVAETSDKCSTSLKV
jgi:ankyrin repeat protein